MESPSVPLFLKSADGFSLHKSDIIPIFSYRSFQAPLFIQTAYQITSIFTIFHLFYRLSMIAVIPAHRYFKKLSILSCFSNNTQPPTCSSVNVPLFRNFANSPDCSASLKDVSRTFISEYGENGHGSAPPWELI